MTNTLAWACINRTDDSPPYQVFPTRQEAIQHEVWNLLEVEPPPEWSAYRGLCPWLHLDSHEVSKAWRRLKRNYGYRAVRVVITVHPRFEPEETP